MSRNIPAKQSVTLAESERGLRDTEDGKLIFTEYRGRQCALLLRGGRVLAASFFSKHDPNIIGAVYIGKVKNIAKNIDACFVEIGEGEICFLPLKKATSPFLTNRIYDGRILEGDEILVQVEREAQKTKQASVTAHISLANDYFAVTLGSDKVGFSAKLSRQMRAKIADLFSTQGIMTDGHLNWGNMEDHFNVSTETFSIEAKKNIQRILSYDSTRKLPSMGVVVRTRVGELTEPEVIIHLYRSIEDFLNLLKAASTRTCFSCLLEALSPWESILHSLAEPGEYTEIVTDNPELYRMLSDYCTVRLPEKVLRLYKDDDLSLSSLYSLETRLEPALKPKVWLKSGGYLVIEPTEALTVIDVNSGKNETGKGEEALRRINYEAAEEIALQLRLRNLSGIILVDFINMKDKKSGEELLEYLRNLVRDHKIKTSVVDITPLGLVEITRKKQSRPLAEQIN